MKAEPNWLIHRRVAVNLVFCIGDLKRIEVWNSAFSLLCPVEFELLFIAHKVLEKVKQSIIRAKRKHFYKQEM